MRHLPAHPHTGNATTRHHHQAGTSALFPLPPLPSSQSLRRRKGRYRPVSTQQTHTLPDLQNAHSPEGQEFNTPASPLHINRPLRGLSSHPYTPSFSEISRLLARGHTILLPGNALRDQPGASHFLSRNNRGAKTGPLMWNTGISLHRRLAPVESISCNPRVQHQDGPRHPAQPRLHDQPQEIDPGPSGYDHLPGHSLARTLPHSPSQQHQLRKIPKTRRKNTPSKQAHKEGLPAAARIPQLHRPIYTRRPFSPSPTNTPRTNIQDVSRGATINNLPQAPPLVEATRKHFSPHSNINPPTTVDDMDGRLPDRMGGGRLPGPNSRRNLVSGGKGQAHQRPRVPSNREMSRKASPPIKHHNYGQNRQHNRCIPHQQTGIQQKQIAQLHPVPAAPDLHPPQLDPQSKTPPGSLEHLGGLAIPRPPNQGGVEPHTGVVQQTQLLPQPSSRSICTPGEHETKNVRLPLSIPNSDSRGRALSELEQVGEDLSIPPTRFNPELPPQTLYICRRRIIHRPTRAISSMVARVRRPMSTTSIRARRRPARTRSTHPGTRSDVLDLPRIQFLTKLYASNFPRSVSIALTAAHRQSTNYQYENCWKNFQQWLQNKEGTAITKSTILLYLTELATVRNLSPKTILVYRNALKLPLLYGFHINTNDREFSLLARGQFLQNPPPRRIIPAWNPNKVLSMLEQPQFLNHRASPHHLLMKTLFLTALACGNRVSEIAAFTRIAANILPGSRKAMLAVRPGFLYKNQTIDHTPPNIVIKSLQNTDGTPHRLCPVDALQHWLDLTKDWGSDAIFINPKSHKPMNRGAISMLLVTTINAGHPRVFAKAHDTRKVSASLAWARGVPPHEIVQTMFWKSSTVFLNKYLIPLKQ